MAELDDLISAWTGQFAAAELLALPEEHAVPGGAFTGRWDSITRRFTGNCSVMMHPTWNACARERLPDQVYGVRVKSHTTQLPARSGMILL